MIEICNNRLSIEQMGGADSITVYVLLVCHCISFVFQLTCPWCPKQSIFLHIWFWASPVHFILFCFYSVAFLVLYYMVWCGSIKTHAFYDPIGYPCLHANIIRTVQLCYGVPSFSKQLELHQCVMTGELAWSLVKSLKYPCMFWNFPCLQASITRISPVVSSSAITFQSTWILYMHDDWKITLSSDKVLQAGRDPMLKQGHPTGSLSKEGTIKFSQDKISCRYGSLIWYCWFSAVFPLKALVTRGSMVLSPQSNQGHGSEHSSKLGNLQFSFCSSKLHIKLHLLTAKLVVYLQIHLKFLLLWPLRKLIQASYLP